MTEIKNFYDLEVWQRVHRFALDIYKITKDFPKDELFGITSQLRRAATSVSANISEGFNRYHFKDKIKFYHQARGSIGEVQNFLLLLKDLGFVVNKKSDILLKEAEGIKRLTNGLINSIIKQS